MDRLTVLGLDLSLTSTGCAKAVGGPLGGDPWTFLIRSAKTGWDRLDSQVTRIGQAIRECDPDLIVVEKHLPRPAAGGAYYHENAGLWWSVTHRIWKTGRPMVCVPVPVLKKFATGTHNADKGAMRVAAARRFNLDRIGPDEADALWLAAAGLQHYGLPLVTLPQVQAAALESIVPAKKRVPAHPAVEWPISLDRSWQDTA